MQQQRILFGQDSIECAAYYTHQALLVVLALCFQDIPQKKRHFAFIFKTRVSRYNMYGSMSGTWPDLRQIF